MDEGQSSNDWETIDELLSQLRLVPVLRHIAHDLNNSVWSIVANLELLKMSSAGDSSSAEVMDTLQAGVERSAQECRLANGILKRTVSARSPRDLCQTVDKACKFLTPAVPNKIKLCCNVATKTEPGGQAEKTIVQTSDLDILIVLRCLIQNAVAAIGTDEGVINIRCNEHDNHGVLSVADDGCGIAQEQLAEFRTAFSGVDRSTFGIGLTSVAEVLYSHRGNVTIDSELGVGTVLYAHFPITN